MALKLRFDGLSEKVSYLCECRKMVRVDVSELTVGSIDYCGCGSTHINLNRNQVNDYRKMTGVSEIEE